MGSDRRGVIRRNQAMAFPTRDADLGITRKTGLNRNTVRRYLAGGVVESRYPDRENPSKLDDYELTLTSWLFRELRRNHKQCKTVRQLRSGLMQLGYTGSYDRVATFARTRYLRQHEGRPG